MSYALRFPNVHQALAFLVSWPALDKAAAIVIERFAELDGDHYEILSPAADALAAKHCQSVARLSDCRSSLPPVLHELHAVAFCRIKC